MHVSQRIFKESPLERGGDETFPYSFSLSPWPAGAYGSPVTVVKDEAGADVSADVLSGDSLINGGVFTTPDFVAGSLSAGSNYRLECRFTIGGKVWEAWGIIQARE